MTLKVTIQPTGHETGKYPVYFTFNGPKGVSIGPAGELILVSEVDNLNQPSGFRIYAPGAWKEINVEETND
jgi:hypothetical protein